MRFASEVIFRYERNLQSNPVSLRSRGSHPSLLSFGGRGLNEKRTAVFAVRVGKKVRRLGFEPRTNWLKANCSTN
jgi:hypothetical protein